MIKGNKPYLFIFYAINTERLCSVIKVSLYFKVHFQYTYSVFTHKSAE